MAQAGRAVPPPVPPPVSAASARMEFVVVEYAAAQATTQALYGRGRALEDAMGEFRARYAAAMADAPMEELRRHRAAAEEYRVVLDDLNERALPRLERAVAEHLAFTHTAPQRWDAAARWAAACDAAAAAAGGEEGGTAFVNALVQKHLTAFPAPAPTAPDQTRHCVNCGTGPAELSIHPAASVADPLLRDDVCCQGVSNLCMCLAGRTHACCEPCWTAYAASSMRDNVRLLATGQTAPPPCCVRCIVCSEQVCALRLAKNTPASDERMTAAAAAAPALHGFNLEDLQGGDEDFFPFLSDIVELDDDIHQSHLLPAGAGLAPVASTAALGGLVPGGVPTPQAAAAETTMMSGGLPVQQPYSSGPDTTPSGSGPTSPASDASMAAVFPALETLGDIFDAVLASTKKSGAGVDAFVKKIRAELDFAGRLGVKPVAPAKKRAPRRGRPQTPSPPSLTDDGVTKRRKSGVRHCTSCGEAGHYKNRCPTAEEQNLLAEAQAEVDRTPPPPPPAGRPPQDPAQPYALPLNTFFQPAVPVGYQAGVAFGYA